MANATLSVRDFILGLLARQPMSGYDIKSLLESLSWLIDIPSYGSLYPALHSLLEDGFVSVEVVPGEDKPPKKIYSATTKGKEVLESRLNRTLSSDASLKAFLMRLILADHLSRPSLLAQLRQRRAQVESDHTAFEKMAERTEESEDLGAQLVQGYSQAIADAELDWLDRVLSRFS
jgi:DNA-binding PadR family transcriptional regulator